MRIVPSFYKAKSRGETAHEIPVFFAPLVCRRKLPARKGKLGPAIPLYISLDRVLTSAARAPEFRSLKKRPCAQSPPDKSASFWTTGARAIRTRAKR